MPAPGINVLLVHDVVELDRLVAHVGEAQALKLARLAASRPQWWGIPKVAYDELAKAVRGLSGKYGEQGSARLALEDLMERYGM